MVRRSRLTGSLRDGAAEQLEQEESETLGTKLKLNGQTTTNPWYGYSCQRRLYNVMYWTCGYQLARCNPL